MCARAVALWCALALAAGAAAYTVDCNHEYTDCDTELGKLPGEEEDSLLPTLPRISMPLNEKMTEMPSFQLTTSSTLPTRTTSAETPTTTENRTEDTTTEEMATETVKPRPRLLNLSVDDLKNFAFALHNQTAVNTKKLTDLSDVTLDGEDEYEPPKVEMPKLEKDIPDKFYTNLQAPFHPILTVDRSDEVREEAELCRENEVSYKIGERIDRACEETCECVPGGIFDCSPRCKHPYIRRGRRINDPLCFESPVDQCCSIIACATGNGDSKVTKLEVCRYGNDTYPVGSKWNVGCEQKCVCEANSVVTCKPRCNPLPQSDKCINVQDPKDACCEVQVCDVSQDVHEEPVENTTSTTTTRTTTKTTTTITTTITTPTTSTTEPSTTTSTTTEPPETTTDSLVTPVIAANRHTLNRSTKPDALPFYDTDEMPRSTRPLVLSEPIGSVKVLQNNSVQVNLMHMNSSKDPINLLLSNDGGRSFKEVELKYDNMILNLDSGKDYILKTRETGTKFNFTITASDPSSKEVKEELIHVTQKIGCHEDGKFYEVGEEFHIGCTELCECVGAERRECAKLECPAHVGLELVSKGCVRWAPTPPPRPPNCCPRAARCLSDGTCHYKEVAIPNWTEVPISLTGCEQRCFCENGELDCQEVCTPLSPLPPQSLRCPPLHRPAPVNISDEDCCKQWGCVPNAGNTSHSYSVPMTDTYYVTPMVPVIPVTEVLPTPADPTDSMLTFYRNLIPAKPIPQVLKAFKPTFKKFEQDMPDDEPRNNMTTGYDFPDEVYKTEAPAKDDAHFKPYKNPFKNRSGYFFPQKPEPTMKRDEIMDKYKMSDHKMHEIIRQPPVTPKNQMTINLLNKYYDTATKIPVQTFEKSHYFAPTYVKTDTDDENYIQPNVNVVTPMPIPYFKPLVIQNHSLLHQPEHVAIPIPDNKVFPLSDTEAFPISTNSDAKHNLLGKHVTVLRTKDLTQKRPTDLQNRWGQSSTNMHVLTKSPSPYETVLMRAVPNPKLETASSYERHLKSPAVSGKPYSTLDLEHLLSQMEVESEVNRNLGRSADKNQDTAAGTPIPDMANSTPTQQTPPFLPTILPEIHFPQDDDSDYEQNNIHRPMNPLVTGIPGLPPGLTVPSNYGDENKKLTVITLESDSPTSIKMLFGLPPVLVGLRGSVDLRYTDTHDEDITHWQSQVFAPADEVLTTSRLEFRLTGLTPGTLYRLRGKLYLHNLPLEPESEVYTIRTHELPVVTAVEEKRREINSRLTVLDVNDTVAHVSWRRFTEEELQYIDGIQIRYRPVGTPIYSMTELLHHSRAAATLRELRAGSRYEASLVLVPPPRAATELVDPAVLEFTTAPYVDPYNWSVSIEARTVGSEAAELTWRGIPSPAERWVRVYRASHACGGARREHDAFRLAARDLPPSITLTGLEPDTRCRVWLELFLTNGKVKTSNVLEINTKSLDSPEQIDNAIEASSVGGRGTAPRGDYYGALVVVGVVAALGALTSLLLLLVVVRRHRPRSVPITPVPTAPRESSLPPYDNPAYKLELQQETMDL